MKATGCRECLGWYVVCTLQLIRGAYILHNLTPHKKKGSKCRRNTCLVDLDNVACMNYYWDNCCFLVPEEMRGRDSRQNMNEKRQEDRQEERKECGLKRKKTWN
jgi:hypothetical protein